MKSTKHSFQWNKVTPLSKYLAMVLFIALPFAGFLSGMKYKGSLTNEMVLTKSVDSIISPTLQTSKTQSMLIRLGSEKNFKVADPNSFNYGSCIYLHGDDGRTNEWEKFEDVRTEQLFKLFSTLPILALNYTSSKNGYDFYIGPLCSCAEYTHAIKLVNSSGLDFKSQLSHAPRNDPRFEKCIDFSTFD